MRHHIVSWASLCAFLLSAECAVGADAPAPSAAEKATVDEAMQLANGGKLDEAVTALDKLIADGTTWENPYIMRSKIRLSQQDAPGALSDIRAALERNPKSVVAIMHHAQIYVATEQAEKAVEILKKANEEMPTSKPVALGLSQMLCGAGKFDAAVPVLEKAVGGGKGDADLPLFRLLAMAYSRTNQPGKALKLTRALTAKSDGMDLEMQNLQLAILNQAKDGMGMLQTADGMLANAALLKAHPEIEPKLKTMRTGIADSWATREGPIVPLVHDLRMRPKDEAAKAALAAAVEKLAAEPAALWGRLVLPTHVAGMASQFGKPAEGQSVPEFGAEVMNKWMDRKGELPERPVMWVYGKRPAEFVDDYQRIEDRLDEYVSKGNWDEIVKLCDDFTTRWPAGRLYHQKAFALAMLGKKADAAKTYAIAAGLRALEMMEHPKGAHEATLRSIEFFEAKMNRSLQSLGESIQWRDGTLSGDQKAVLDGALAVAADPEKAIPMAAAYQRLTKGDSYDAVTHTLEREMVKSVASRYRGTVLPLVGRQLQQALDANNLAAAGAVIPAVEVFKAPMFASREGEEVFNAVAMYYAITKDPEKRDAAIEEVCRSAKCTPVTFVLWGQALEEKGKKLEAMLAFNAAAGGRAKEQLKEPREVLAAAARDRLEGTTDVHKRDALYVPLVNKPDDEPIDRNNMLMLAALERISIGKSNGPPIFMEKANRALKLQLYDRAYRHAGEAIDGGYAKADDAWQVRVEALVSRNRPGDAAQAVADADAGLRVNPKNEWLLYHKSHAHKLQGKKTEAIADLTAALAISDKNALFYKERSELHEQVGNIQEAADDIDKYCAMTGDVGLLDEGKRMVRLHTMLLENAMKKIGD